MAKEVKFIVSVNTKTGEMNIKKITKEMQKFARESEKSVEKVAKKGKTSAAVFQASWLKAVAAIYAIKKAWDIVNFAAQTDQQAKAFDNLAKSHGVASNEIIANLKKTSAGAVDTATLIKAAGTAMMMGLDPSKLDKLMKIARATSRMTGQTMTQAFNDVTLAVGRQSKMILDNLGIIVSVEEANKRYADSLGKTSSQLTDVERKQAFLNETIRKGDELVKRIGVSGKSTAEELQTFEAALKDLGTETITTLLPETITTLLPLIKEATKSFKAWSFWLKSFQIKDAIKQHKNLITELDNTINRLDKLQKIVNTPTGFWAMLYHYGKHGAAGIKLARIELKKLQAELPVLAQLQKDKEALDRALASGTYKPSIKQESTTTDTTIPTTTTGKPSFDLDYQTKYYIEWYAKRLKIEKDFQVSKGKLIEEATVTTLDMEQTVYDRAEENLERWKENITTVQDMWMQGSEMFASGFVDAITDADTSFSDFAKNFLRQIAAMILQAQILNAIKGASSFMGFADGAVFNQSGVTPFAQGGVVNQPTVFPFAGGIGLMGEAGPEAIMPLSRGIDGKLGVKSSGDNQPQQVTYIIQAIDSQSFYDAVRRNPEAITSVMNNEMELGNSALNNNIRRVSM